MVSLSDEWYKNPPKTYQRTQSNINCKPTKTSPLLIAVHLKVSITPFHLHTTGPYISVHGSRNSHRVDTENCFAALYAQINKPVNWFRGIFVKNDSFPFVGRSCTIRMSVLCWSKTYRNQNIYCYKIRPTCESKGIIHQWRIENKISQ